MAKEEENKALSSLGAEGWDFTNLDYCPQMLDTHEESVPIDGASRPVLYSLSASFDGHRT